jgi:peptide deformylase
MNRISKIKIAFYILILVGILGITGWWAFERISLSERCSLEIVTYPNPVLKEVAHPVEKIGPEERELAQLMINTMEKAGGVGLAAPQVGVSQRIIVVKLDRGFFSNEILAMINPEIIEKSENIVYGLEKCLSIPRKIVNVPRSKWIKVKFLTLEGEEKILIEYGWNARIIQHEIDHLNGILIIDYQ